MGAIPGGIGAPQGRRADADYFVGVADVEVIAPQGGGASRTASSSRPRRVAHGVTVGAFADNARCQDRRRARSQG